MCGGSVVLLFVAWLIRSDFFHGGAAGITRIPLFYLPSCYAQHGIVLAGNGHHFIQDQFAGMDCLLVLHCVDGGVFLWNFLS